MKFSFINLLFFIALNVLSRLSFAQYGNDIINEISKKDSTVLLSRDSIIIIPEKGNPEHFSKDNLQNIIFSYPELNRDYPSPPDISYTLGNDCKLINDNELAIIFSSEAGKDLYYKLYAYFLSLKNGVSTYTSSRSALIKIFRDINYIHAVIANGGTYFSHTGFRILAYVEYDIYKYKLESDLFDKKYNFLHQKKIFIDALRQYVIDEIDTDNDYLGSKKKNIKTELLSKIAEIDGLITSSFYLIESREFQYAHYEQ